MRAINIYSFTRNLNKDLFPQFEQSLSSRADVWKYKADEIKTLRLLANTLVDRVEPYGLDNWFYSYVIANIQKEFDLLKIGPDKSVLNIELKSADDKDKILKQQRRNAYYLSVVSEDVTIFTCAMLKDLTFKIYKYENDDAVDVTLDELIDAINTFDKAISTGIEDMFAPIRFLVSPLNNREDFINGRYFLTEHQENIKKEIVDAALKGKAIYGITGGAGTGKTLLMYDIAKELSKTYKVAIIHCGIPGECHKQFNDVYENFDVYAVKDVFHWHSKIVADHDVLFIDESQRIYPTQLNSIFEKYNEDKIQCCIFAYDHEQAMAVDETEWNNAKTIREYNGLKEYALTGKIRQNEEIYRFIQKMFDTRAILPRRYEYKDIDVVYANKATEVDKLISIYEAKDYRYIAYTPDNGSNYQGHFYSETNNTHRVIGQEFDKVVTLLDSHFSYDSRGVLEAEPHPCRNYLFLKLFYQNVTRAKAKLCIIVYDQPQVFEMLLKIKLNLLEGDKEDNL